MGISRTGCWVTAESSHMFPPQSTGLLLNQCCVVGERKKTKNKTSSQWHFSSHLSSFKLPLKRKLQQWLWCESDTLRDTLSVSADAQLDYHSDESLSDVFYPASLQSWRDERFQRWRANRQRLITPNGKRGKKNGVSSLSSGLSQSDTGRTAETAFN